MHHRDDIQPTPAEDELNLGYNDDELLASDDHLFGILLLISLTGIVLVSIIALAITRIQI